MKQYAIIGFGCAGYHAAAAIRALDREALIHVYSDHAEAPYNPVLTTYRAASKIDRSAMFPFGSLEEISEKLTLTVFKNAEVKAVKAKEKTVVLSDGTERRYDAILIATGAGAVVPPLPGLSGERICMMRTKEDSDRLFELVNGGKLKKALVVGASWVGVKCAEVLAGAGIDTTLADMVDYFFPTAAYRDVGRELNRRVQERGIHLAFGRGLKGVRHTENTSIADFTDGSSVEADLIVLCIGIRANVSMLDPAEVKIGRGVVVDTRMRTSCEGIYAAGDCSEGNDIQSGENKIIGLWANAGYQGRTAGINMAGGRIEYAGSIVHNITHFLDMDFIGLGDCRIGGEVLTFGDIQGDLYVQAHVEDGRLAGVNILENSRISGPIKNYFVKLLEGKTRGISDFQRGILNAEGLSQSFIDRLEGKLK